MAAEGIVLYCDDSPERPGYEPQNGDVGYTLYFPLHDGLTLVLKAGKDTYANFVDILAASATDDALDS